jgi:hypothetical protein
MNIHSKDRSAAMPRHLSPSALGLAVTAVLSLLTITALAQDPTPMAPPVQTDAPQGDSAGADSVFHWQEVPQGQEVPLTHAAFDQGGYQLYDTQGETIIIPFNSQNLYVMKFARSATGAMYFVNEGDAPVLYVPRHGYLGNATVAGARWYPFGKGFHPAQPVYLGIAPSWSGFVGMGWYPDMYAYGGYWGQTSFLQGGVFGPSIGLFFEIGGQHYSGWNGYRHYSQGHPDFAHTGYYRRDFYKAAARPRASMHPFGGANHTYTAHRAFVGARDAGGHPGLGGHSANGGAHTFRGATHSGQNGHSPGGFPGGTGHQGGARPNSGARPSGLPGGNGGHQGGISGHTSGGGHPGGGGNQGGGHQGGDDHQGSGGDDHQGGGGDHH